MNIILKSAVPIILAVFLASCGSIQPISKPMDLESAIVEAVSALKNAEKRTAGGKKIGMYPAEAKIVFNVVGTESRSQGLDAGASGGGASLKVNFQRTRTNTQGNTIEILLKSLYSGGAGTTKPDIIFNAAKPQ